MPAIVITADQIVHHSISLDLMRTGRLVRVEITRPTYRLDCAECGNEFLTGRRHAVVCGEQCRIVRTRRQTRERVARHRGAT